jgi:hypothetical protein
MLRHRTEEAIMSVLQIMDVLARPIDAAVGAAVIARLRASAS